MIYSSLNGKNFDMDKKVLERDYAYKKQNIKRVPLDMQITEYEDVKSIAESLHMPVNTLIKTAIREYIDKIGGDRYR